MLKKLIIVWILFLILSTTIVSYNLGKYNMASQKDIVISLMNETIKKGEVNITNKQAIINALNDRIKKITQSNQELSTDYNKLQTQVLGLTTTKKAIYPFQIPTDGIIGSFAGTFGGNMYGMRHLGVDLWTSVQNGGKVSGGIGNAVYSACNGIVENIEPANAAIIIKCDKISSEYLIPEHQVYTYYGHMGDADTKNLFIDIEKGQRVKMGQYLGFQGNLSSFFPEMENTHLHFSVFAGYSENDPQKGALNPCLYIGGDCSRKGNEFQTGLVSQ